MTNMPGTYFLNVVHERRESPILGSIFHYVNLCVGYNVSFYVLVGKFKCVENKCLKCSNV